jgi:hypothetical protein
MKDSDRRESSAWPVSWADNREDQLTRALAASPAERLAWLEEAIHLAFFAGALPKDETAERRSSLR